MYPDLLFLYPDLINKFIITIAGFRVKFVRLVEIIRSYSL